MNEKQVSKSYYSPKFRSQHRYPVTELLPFNPFDSTGLFLYPLKTSETQEVF